MIMDRYLLQFPLRPKGRPYPEPNSVIFYYQNDVQAKFKPENDILRLNYVLPRDEHYDENAPDKQAISEMGMYLEAFDNCLVLQSHRNPAKATYAIGVTHNGSIYLTPVRLYLVVDE